MPVAVQRNKEGHACDYQCDMPRAGFENISEELKEQRFQELLSSTHNSIECSHAVSPWSRSIRERLRSQDGVDVLVLPVQYRLAQEGTSHLRLLPATAGIPIQLAATHHEHSRGTPRSLPSMDYVLYAGPGFRGPANGALASSIAANGAVGLRDRTLRLMDSFGYGQLAGNTFIETAAAPGPSPPGPSLSRTGGIDTHNNRVDFTMTSPTPYAP